MPDGGDEVAFSLRTSFGGGPAGAEDRLSTPACGFEVVSSRSRDSRVVGCRSVPAFPCAEGALRVAFTVFSAPVVFLFDGFSFADSTRGGLLDVAEDLAAASLMLLSEGAERRATFGLEDFAFSTAAARS